MFYLNQTKYVNLTPTPTAQELKEIKEQIILYHKETIIPQGNNQTNP